MRLTLRNPFRRPGLMPLVLAVVVAFWPVWVWYCSRITDGSDEPWGVLALVTVVCLLRRQAMEAPAGWQMAGVCALLMLYLATFQISFPLVRAIIAVSALALLFARTKSPLGIWSLLFLSLPVVPSLQFFAGYPLRVLVAHTSATLLNHCGFGVTCEGAALYFGGETVLVDAPCSGLKMVWAGLYFAATLACCRGLKAGATLGLFVATGVIIVAANILRSTLLFFKEAHIIAAPNWTHSATGLVTFAMAALAIQWISSCLKGRCIG